MIYKGIAYAVVIISLLIALHDLYNFHKYLKTTKSGFVAKLANFIVTTMIVACDLYIGKCIVDYLEGLAHGI